MANFDGVYVKVKDLFSYDNKTVELGHYAMNNGTTYGDKVYIFEHYTKKNGEECSHSVAKFTKDEFKTLCTMGVKIEW